MKLKKLFLFSSFILVFAISANAQAYKTGIGLRFGYESGLTMKHYFTSFDTGELLATVSPDYFHLTGLYQNQKPMPGVQNMYWYIGAGAHIGTTNKKEDKVIKNRLSIGTDFILGLEFVFPQMPFSMSLDWKPTFNYINNENDNWYSPLTLSLRYVFK